MCDKTHSYMTNPFICGKTYSYVCKNRGNKDEHNNPEGWEIQQHPTCSLALTPKIALKFTKNLVQLRPNKIWVGFCFEAGEGGGRRGRGWSKLVSMLSMCTCACMRVQVSEGVYVGMCAGTRAPSSSSFLPNVSLYIYLLPALLLYAHIYRLALVYLVFVARARVCQREREREREREHA